MLLMIIVLGVAITSLVSEIIIYYHDSVHLQNVAGLGKKKYS